MRSSVIILLCLLFAEAVAQPVADLPDDFLSKDFHRERREKLREMLPKNSVAVFFAAPVRNRSNDVNYVFHQNPDFYYLTGYREPHAVLLVFKEKQRAADGSAYDEIVFAQPRNERFEQWTGRRLGPNGVKERLGFEQVFNNFDFARYNVDFNKFDQILFFDFHNDVRDVPRDSADLYDLIEQFKAKVNYPSDKTLSIAREPEKNKLNTSDLPRMMSRLRGIKTQDEIALLRKAVDISCMGQREVMRAIRPGMSEREIQGIHEFVFKKYQAEDVGYPSIVGAGHNGCILHYEDNYRPEVSNKELILMDLGAEYRGYTADVTRTIPVSGKFSPEQKQIYELVLRAQRAAEKLGKPGVNFSDLSDVTRKVIGEGLLELGIIKDERQSRRFYPHGCCHHIGLDVHDRGEYDVLQENMVITIEPGIYIPEGSDCDPKWWNIAVRIEDDYLITKDGIERLSTLAPNTVEEIEALMKEPSPLDDFVLPELKSKKD